MMVKVQFVPRAGQFLASNEMAVKCIEKWPVLEND
jgi:hypothetical protein